MIKFVIFDLWQTLAYRDAKYGTAIQILKAAQVKLPKTKAIKIFEQSLQLKKWKSKKQAYTNLCKNIGLKITNQNIDWLMNMRDYAEARTKLYPYATTLLKKLKQGGYKIGLISNSSVFEVRQIKKTNILKYINYPLFSFGVRVIKPNLKFFKTMLKIAKCKPNKALMIGDKLNDDVIPARKLGLKAIRFKNYNQLKKSLVRLKINI
jgi:HAD superfamily hydrolase (TIGR01549 family)